MGVYLPETVCFGAIPSRLERKRRQKRLHLPAVPGLPLRAIAWTAAYSVLGLWGITADFSHVDRQMIPCLTALVGGGYLLLLLWGAVRLLLGLQHLALPKWRWLLPAFAAAPGILINYPRLKGRVTRLAEWCISVYAWGVLLYFVQPLLTGLLWLATGEWVFWKVFSVDAVTGTLDMLTVSAAFAAGVWLLFTGWARWNLYHYGGLDRRKPRPAVTIEDTAALFQVSVEFVQAARCAQVVSLSQGAHGPEIDIRSYLRNAECQLGPIRQVVEFNPDGERIVVARNKEEALA